MRNISSKKRIILIVLFIFVLCLSIGFSAFSNILKIKTDAVVKASLGVKFSSDPTEFKTDPITPVLSKDSIKAEAAYIDTKNPTTIKNLNVEFSERGTSVTYTFYVINKGSTKAYLSGINFLNAEGYDSSKVCLINGTEINESLSDICKGISVSLQIGDDETIYTESVELSNHPLEAMQSEKVVITISYSSDAVEATEKFNVKYGNLSFSYSSVDTNTPNLDNSYCFISTTMGEITAYDNTCSRDVVIPDNLELPLSTVKSATYNESKCMAYAKSSSDMTDSEIKSFCDYYKENYSTLSIPIQYSIGDVTIEKSTDTYLVTNIGESSFVGSNITGVVISNSISSIGSSAFSNNKLTNVIIPDSITNIGDSAFSYNRLTSVSIPSSVTSIGESVFEENELTSVEIPNSISSIGNYAFSYNRLTSVSIPSSVTNIGDYAFETNKLTSISIPSGVTNIGEFAFAENELTSVEIPNSVVTIKDRAFENNKIASVTIPKNLTTVGYFVFASNKITNVIIPDGVKVIGYGMFYKNELTSVNIPDSVTRIETHAFNYNNITSVEIGSGIEYLGSHCFYNDKEIDENNNITYGPNEIKVFKIHKTEDKSIFKDGSVTRTIFIGSDGNSNSNIIWDS